MYKQKKKTKQKHSPPCQTNGHLKLGFQKWTNIEEISG